MPANINDDDIYVLKFGFMIFKLRFIAEIQHKHKQWRFQVNLEPYGKLYEKSR